MTIRYLLPVLATLFIAHGSALGQESLSFTDDFADGIGHPGTWLPNGLGSGDWDHGDVVDGQTWLIQFDGTFPPVTAAAKRDSGPLGSTGNGIAGRLRILSNSVVSAGAAINLTTLLDAGTLTISNFGDGTERSGLKTRLLSGNGTVGLEIVVANCPTDHLIIEASQVNAGIFVTCDDQILWRGSNGANVVINFDAQSDTFDVVATDTDGGGPVTLGTTAFDNPIDRVARIELEGFLGDGAETNVGSEVSFESISLTGTNFIHEVSSDPVARDTIALEFPSQIDVVYGLDSTTDLTAPNSFTSAGAFTIGDGTDQSLHDPAGFSENKSYRVVIDPPEIKPY